MAYYSQEKIDEVNEAADLVELIANYVNLKRAGAVYKGLCPFHSEKTPSFVVTPHRRMFHCFGCGVGGGPIRFLMMITGLSFPEAVFELARRYGVDLPSPEPGAGSGAENRENKAALFAVLSKAKEFFEAKLWSSEGQEARSYLAGRGLNQQLIKDFGLGLARPGWDSLRKHLAGEGFSDQIMLEAGLVKPGREEGHYYDLFRDRLMVPIVDGEGRVAAFGGRALSEAENQAKYLNSPETPVYQKGGLLFGFRRARPYLRSAGLVFLVEGYFDLIALVAGGINEVVAPLGTALTLRQANLLRGQVEKVLLAFDSDEAGQRAAVRALPVLLNAELEGRVLNLPKGHDPDTFIREFGPEAMFEAAGQAQDIVDFVAGRLKRAFPDTLSGQAKMLREVRETLGLVPDEGKRWLLARRLGELLNLEPSLFGDKGSSAGRRLTKTSVPIDNQPKNTLDPTAGELLRLILVHPEAAGPVLAEMAAWWPDDVSRQLFQRLRDVYAAKGGGGLIDGTWCDDSDELAVLVAAAAVSERLYSIEESMAVAADLMERLRRNWRRKRQSEISEAVALAQAAGDENEVLRLLSEKRALSLK